MSALCGLSLCRALYLCESVKTLCAVCPCMSVNMVVACGGLRLRTARYNRCAVRKDCHLPVGPEIWPKKAVDSQICFFEIKA